MNRRKKTLRRFFLPAFALRGTIPIEQRDSFASAQEACIRTYGIEGLGGPTNDDPRRGRQTGHQGNAHEGMIMNIPVTVPSLATVITRYRCAYLLTTSATGAPHAAPVAAVLHGGELVVHGSGRRTRDNALARPAVGLLWPPHSAADYSLFVDGQAV